MSLSTQALQRTVAVLQKVGEPEQLFEAVIDLLRTVVDLEGATVFHWEEKSRRLEAVYTLGEHVVDLAPEADFEGGSGFSAWIGRRKTPVILGSIPKSRAGRLYHMNSFVALPLWSQDRFLGVLNFYHSAPGKYQPDMKPELEVVSSYLALALERLQLQADLTARNEALATALAELRRTQQELIDKERLAAVGELVITINHEINNPLTAIMGAAELGKSMLSLGKSERLTQHLDLILESAERIQRITEKIRALKQARATTYVGEFNMLELPRDS